jgi:hypothetical protein
MPKVFQKLFMVNIQRVKTNLFSRMIRFKISQDKNSKLTN